MLDFLKFGFSSSNGEEEQKVLDSFKQEEKTEQEGKEQNVRSNGNLKEGETTVRPKTAKPVNPLTDRKKILVSSNKDIKEGKENQKNWKEQNRSYSGTLRNVYLHYSAKDKESKVFRDSFNAFENLRSVLDSAKNRDSFTNLLDKWLKANICEGLKVEKEGKIIFGKWDYEKVMLVSYDSNGNEIIKPKFYYTGKTDSFGNPEKKPVYKLDPNGNYIDLFVPYENGKWSINALFSLLNDNEERITKAKSMGITFNEINVCDIPEQGEQKEGEQIVPISNKGIVPEQGEQLIPEQGEQLIPEQGEQLIPEQGEQNVSNVG